MEKQDIRALSKEQLTDYFKQIGEPSFRAKQVYEWLWQKSVFTFEAMTNLSKKLREKLEAEFVIRPIQTHFVQYSEDGTVKTRFQLHDGHFIESVLIPVEEKERFTVCISTQVGCSLTCKFCATGQMKRIRNLDAAEIYDQVVLVARQCQEVYDSPITNVVYMGMGEPLLNYAEVLRSVELLTTEDGLGMAARRLTISTAGIAKMIKKLADDGTRTNLALSLHAADDVKRNEIMPINETNNLEVLVEALNYYHELRPDNKLTFEYIAFQGFNDSLEDARRLVQLCRRVPTVRVNIIEYNTVEGVEFVKTSADRLDAFVAYLSQNDVDVTVRKSRGKDIDAACGQLANKGS